MTETTHRGFARVRLALLTLCASSLLLASSASAATLTIDIEGSFGTVTDWSGAIDCSGPPETGTCSASFPDQVVQLVLEASPALSFSGWSGLAGEIGIPEDNCRGLTNPCMVWLSSDKTLTATFGGGGGPEEPECFIEPWECEGEEPDCLIEPWECEGEEPEPCTQGFGRYIVVFHSWVEDPKAVAHEQVERYGGKLGFVYQYALKGYSAGYPTDVIGAVEGEPTVNYVEEDQVVEAFGASSSSEGSECEEEETALDPEPESQSNSGLEPETGEPPRTPAPLGAANSTANGTDARGARSNSTIFGPVRTRRCGKAAVHRFGRCARSRALARRACRKRTGGARRRCMRRTLRSLTRLARRQRVSAAMPARR